MLAKDTRLNEYRLEGLLGRGAFGDVWLAENEIAVGHDPRWVALKIPHNQDVNLLEEARNLALLDHPNIARLYRPGRSDGLIFLAVEYVGGGSLSAKLKNSRTLSEDEAVRIAVQVLNALEYLHAKGIVHADLKPDNILFVENGIAKLADFGLARFISKDGSYVPASGGTPHYMAPEVYEGKNRTASDLWALAVVLCQMLTSRLPFEAANIPALALKISSAPPDLPASLSASMRHVLETALAKNPRERYANAAAMRAAIKKPPLIEKPSLSENENDGTLLAPIPEGEFPSRGYLLRGIHPIGMAGEEVEILGAVKGDYGGTRYRVRTLDGEGETSSVSITDPRTYFRMTGPRDAEGYLVGSLGQGISIEEVWFTDTELGCDITVAIADIDSVEMNGVSLAVTLRGGKVINSALEYLESAGTRVINRRIFQLIVPSVHGYISWVPGEIAQSGHVTLLKKAGPPCDRQAPKITVHG